MSSRQRRPSLRGCTWAARALALTRPRRGPSAAHRRGCYRSPTSSCASVTFSTNPKAGEGEGDVSSERFRTIGTLFTGRDAACDTSMPHTLSPRFDGAALSLARSRRPKRFACASLPHTAPRKRRGGRIFLSLLLTFASNQSVRQQQQPTEWRQERYCCCAAGVRWWWPPLRLIA